MAEDFASDFANFKECFLVSLAAERVLNVTKYLEKKSQSLSNTFWNNKSPSTARSTDSVSVSRAGSRVMN